MKHKMQKLKIKYANRNIKMICKTKTKQNKMLEGKDGQDDAHVAQVLEQVGDEVDFVVISLDKPFQL